MNKNRNETGAAIGGSSLIAIFAVLCLVTFAVLGLATVGADQRLMADMTNAIDYYYQADSKAQLMLSELRAGWEPMGVTEIDEGVYAWTVGSANGVMLDCRVRIEPDGGYEILRWSAVRESEWEGDFSLPVWTGDFS